MPSARRPWTEGLPARRLERARDAELPASDVWPLTIPAVAQVLAHGIDLAACTVLVGENCSGKSTLVEALAMAAGMNAEGGSTGATHRTHASESPLHEWVTVVRDPGAPRWGYFVRAET
ncbi:MAG: AAA family ATPase, partial [Dermatophilaceae bacterium]|nr:AAA family ATPase [Dermatophilaceae bacterium]